jgi:hypothetical protein
LAQTLFGIKIDFKLSVAVNWQVAVAIEPNGNLKKS